MNYILILLLYIFICFVSQSFGRFIVRSLNINFDYFAIHIGFASWLATLFFVSQIVLRFNPSSQSLFLVFGILTVIILILSRHDLKIKQITKIDFLSLGLMILFVLLSLRYTMGEQLGDNSFLISLVTKNINTPLINNFDIATGFEADVAIMTSQKDVLTFYHFYAFLLFGLSKVAQFFKITTLPMYVYYIWTASLFFYHLSIALVFGIAQKFKVKSVYTWGLLLLFPILYIGSIYFNLTLAYYGITYLAVFISLLLLLLNEYANSRQISIIIPIVIVSIMLHALGVIGIIASAYLSFAFIATLWILKDEKSFLFGAYLLIPLVLSTWSIQDFIPISNFYFMLFVLCITLFVLHNMKSIKAWMLKNGLWILSIIWIILLIVSITQTDAYFESMLQFFEPKENFDRVRDYFTFNNPLSVIRNLLHYSFIIALWFNKETRWMSVMICVILIFFINPLMFPLFYPYLVFLYHRAYYVVFNIATISLGLISLINLLRRHTKKMILLGTLGLSVIYLLMNNLISYESNIYIPNDDYDPFLKMNNKQVDILTVLSDKIEIEGYHNAKVISQIYGSLIFVPEMQHLYFNTLNRRQWDPRLENTYEELFKIFYTPVFPGDDGPRFSTNYSLTCNLLIENKIDFIIYDKELSVYDETSMNWIPIHWYARGCAEKAYENKRYIMYRFYWK